MKYFIWTCKWCWHTQCQKTVDKQLKANKMSISYCAKLKWYCAKIKAGHKQVWIRRAGKVSSSKREPTKQLLFIAAPTHPPKKNKKLFKPSNSEIPQWYDDQLHCEDVKLQWLISIFSMKAFFTISLPFISLLNKVAWLYSLSSTKSPSACKKTYRRAMLYVEGNTYNWCLIDEESFEAFSFEKHYTKPVHYAWKVASLHSMNTSHVTLSRGYTGLAHYSCLFTKVNERWFSKQY